MVDFWLAKPPQWWPHHCTVVQLQPALHYILTNWLAGLNSCGGPDSAYYNILHKILPKLLTYSQKILPLFIPVIRSQAREVYKSFGCK